MKSFYEFYEQVQQTKLTDELNVILEMPMRNRGDFDQYGSAGGNINPWLGHTADDGQQGRRTSDIPDKGAKRANQEKRAGFHSAADQGDEAIARGAVETPEGGIAPGVQAAYARKIGQKNAEERDTEKAIDDQIGYGHNVRRGFKPIKSELSPEERLARQTGEEDIEARASTNDGDKHLRNAIRDNLTKLGGVEGIDALLSTAAPIKDFDTLKCLKDLWQATDLHNNSKEGGKAAVRELNQKIAQILFHQ